MINKIDNNYPLDITPIKNFPESIREKGKQIEKYIKDLETYRSNNTFGSSIDLFPEYKFLFIHSNSSIPAGLYFKANDSWIGYSNYSFIPYSTNVPEGTRVSYGHQTYELQLDSNQKVWTNKIDFTPSLFFDFFETDGTNIELQNKGFKESDIEMVLLNFKRNEEEIIPFIKTEKFTSIKTNKTYHSSKFLTYTALFKNIERLYSNDEPISMQSKAVLLSINDEFQNIRIGLCYDKDNTLYYYDKETLHNLNIQLSTHLPYQISMKFFNNKLTIILNNEELEQKFDIDISDKNLYFGLASDMGYGRYSNGSFLVSEPEIFDIAISKKENLWLMDYPRTWSFLNTKSYINLTLDEQLKLKKNINSLNLVETQQKTFKELIEEKFNDNNKKLNEFIQNTNNSIETQINSKLAVLNQVETFISEKERIIENLNLQITELAKKIVALENKK